MFRGYAECDAFQNNRMDIRVTTRSRNRSLLLLLSCVSLLVGFFVGWRLSRRAVMSTSIETQRSYLREKGNAPDSLRAEVLDSLREFQNGYSKRNPQELDAFMQRLFPKDEDTRIIGTNDAEWRTGYDSVARFIRDDWLQWGDVILAVDDAVVSSSGEAAWLATVGKVSSWNSTRSIRFTAVLTHKNGRWLFRQIQFQWDERPLRFGDLFDRENWRHRNSP